MFHTNHAPTATSGFKPPSTYGRQTQKSPSRPDIPGLPFVQHYCDCFLCCRHLILWDVPIGQAHSYTYSCNGSKEIPRRNFLSLE